jgi:hypothetical protein
MAPSTLTPSIVTHRVQRVVSAGDFSALHAADQDIVLRVRPSTRAARSATRLVGNVTTVQFTVEAGQVRAAIIGVDHRLPVQRPATLAAALALAMAGVSAVLTTDGSEVTVR